MYVTCNSIFKWLKPLNKNKIPVIFRFVTRPSRYSGVKLGTIDKQRLQLGRHPDVTKRSLSDVTMSLFSQGSSRVSDLDLFLCKLRVVDQRGRTKY